MNPENDPRMILREAPMSAFQLSVVALCIAINMADGFDILISGFAAPLISSDLHLSVAVLGLFLSASPAGMIIGALLLSPLADIAGRRRLVVVCLVLVTAGMSLTAFAGQLPLLVAGRALTGIGVGAMMAAINTVVAEVASERRRNAAICLQAAGFPLGGVVGGLAFLLFTDSGWRFFFGLGAVAAALLIVAVLLILPESLDFLMARRPRDAETRINAILRSCGLAPVALPPFQVARPAAMPAPAMLGNRESMAICASFFLVMFTFYFLSSWAPKILAEGGASLRSGLTGAMTISMGGVAGDLAFAVLTGRARPHRLGGMFCIACVASAALFAAGAARPALMLPAALALGFFLYGAIASHYAIVPTIYPGTIRTAGTGLALACGRCGATLGPSVGGVLLAAAPGTLAVILSMCAPLVLCALIFRFFATRPSKL